MVAVEWSTGRPQLAATGVSLLLTTTTLVYEVNDLRDDPKRPLLIATTAWTAALVTQSVVELIRHHHPSVPESNRRTIIQPTVGPGMELGVDLQGSF